MHPEFLSLLSCVVLWPFWGIISNVSSEGSSTSNRVRVGCEKIRAQQSSSLAKRPASQEDGRGPYTGILSQSGGSCQGADWQGEHWHPFAQGTSLPLSPVP